MAVKVGSSSCALLRRMASKARGTKRRGKEGSTRTSSAVVPNLVGAGSRSVRLTLTLILILTRNQVRDLPPGRTSLMDLRRDDERAMPGPRMGRGGGMGEVWVGEPVPGQREVEGRGGAFWYEVPH